MLKSKFSSEQPDLAVSFGSSGKLKTTFSQENEQNLTAGFQSTGRLKSSFDKTTDLETILKLLKQCYTKIYQDTEENWNIQTDIIAERNAIYVYTNHSYLNDESSNLTPVPAIKIGDGTSYLIDLPFAWQDKDSQIGDLTGLGSLAYKDNASGSYTPKGSISQPSFTGNSLRSQGTFIPSGSVSISTNTTENKTATVGPESGDATYTPEGTIAAPIISVSAVGETTTVNSITDVGSLPQLTTTVIDEVLSIGWNAGNLPVKGADTSVKISDASYQASIPIFTGTPVRLVTDDIAVPSTYNATFTGIEGDIQVEGTPSGTVSQPTFTGTTEIITVT